MWSKKYVKIFTRVEKMVFKKKKLYLQPTDNDVLRRFTNKQESIRSSIIYEIGLARSTAYTSN